MCCAVFGIVSCSVPFVFPNSSLWMIISCGEERGKCFPTSELRRRVAVGKQRAREDLLTSFSFLVFSQGKIADVEKKREAHYLPLLVCSVYAVFTVSNASIAIF